MDSPSPQELTRPLHLLVLSQTPSPTSQTLHPNFLSALTAAAPNASVTSFSGYTSHPPLRLETKYYKASIGIWCDEIPVAQPSVIEDGKTTERPKDETEASSRESIGLTGQENPQGSGSDNVTQDVDVGKSDPTGDWTANFLSEEAQEVLTALGAVVLLLPSSAGRSAREDPAVLDAAREVRQKAEEERTGADVLGICVINGNGGMSRESESEMEDSVMDVLGLGWEVVFWDGKAQLDEKEKERRNEFGGRSQIHFSQNAGSDISCNAITTSTIGIILPKWTIGPNI